MLELEVNKEHRKCKLSNLRINKKIKISAISMSIFISLFSGSKNTLACDDSIKEDLIINTENNDAKIKDIYNADYLLDNSIVRKCITAVFFWF